MKNLTPEKETALRNEANDLDYDFMVDKIKGNKLSQKQEQALERYKKLNAEVKSLKEA